MKRKMCLILTLLILLSISTTAFAAPESKVNDIQTLAEKYGVEILEDYDGEILVELESIEELEKILKDINLMQSQVIECEYSEEVSTDGQLFTTPMSPIMLATTYTGYKRITWYSPFWYFGISLYMFQWKNVGFNYSYYFDNGNPRFSSLSNISSWVTGYQTGVTYTHTGSNYPITNYSTSTKASITTYGTLRLGVEIAGIPVAITINQTWNCSFTLT